DALGGEEPALEVMIRGPVERGEEARAQADDFRVPVDAQVGRPREAVGRPGGLLSEDEEVLLPRGFHAEGQGRLRQAVRIQVGRVVPFSPQRQRKNWREMTYLRAVAGDSRVSTRRGGNETTFLPLFFSRSSRSRWMACRS